MSRSLCMIHNNVDRRSSIGKIARWAVETALNAGWRVTVVARDLDPTLSDHVEWRPLYVPPRIHAIQWAAARATIRHAMRSTNFDLTHAFQAQVASIADIYHVEYLSKPAQAAGSYPLGPGARAALTGAQARTVGMLEDQYLRHLGRRPGLLFCSELMETEFRKRYPTPRASWVLPNPNPVPVELSDHARAVARGSLAGGYAGPVWGYLGGWDPRKGYPELFEALRLSPTARLLFAGPGGKGQVPADLRDRVTVLGHLDGLREFFSAIDVLAVPSRFEPYGLVVGEAAAHGIPVVASSAVGAAPLVAEFEAGEVADGAIDVAAALARWAGASGPARTAAHRFAASTSEVALGARLLEIYGG